MHHLMNRNKILRMADAGAGEGGVGGDGGAKSWFEPLDAEVKGYLQTRGLDKKTAVDAFSEAYKAHREAEKLIGAPANEIIRLPKDPNAPEWKGVWERLGKPVEEKGYDLSTVKRTGDKPIEDALADTLRKAAFEANLPKDAATRVAASVIKHLDAEAAATAALATDKLNLEKSELKKNWGANEAANMVIAQAAVKALGVDPAAVAALEKVIGYSKVMDMFRNIGSKIGEDKFVNAGGGGNSGVMTREQAVSEKAELMRDSAWTKRYTAGGVEESRKMQALNRIITNTTV
jgi:hypothetical protein